MFSFKKSEEKHFQKHLWLSGTYLVSRRQFSSPQKATFRVNFVQNYFHQAQVNSCCWNLLTLVTLTHSYSVYLSTLVYPCLPSSLNWSQLQVWRSFSSDPSPIIVFNLVDIQMLRFDRDFEAKFWSTCDMTWRRYFDERTQPLGPSVLWQCLLFISLSPIPFPLDQFQIILGGV